MNKIFIEPDAYLSNDLKDVEKEDFHWVLHGSAKLNIEQSIFSEYKNNLVIAEPGYGKTSFLQQIVTVAQRHKIEALFVDLKSIQELNLLELEKHFDEFINRDDQYIVCLDAFDEVSKENLINLIDTIKALVNKNQNGKFFISCRSHQFKEWNDFFISFPKQETALIKISKLSSDQIDQYFLNNSLNLELSRKVQNNFRYRNVSFLVSTPRYLSFVIKRILQEPSADINKISVESIFDFCLDSKLNEEAKKSNENTQTKRVLIKKAQQIIALIMCFNQSRKIDETDLLKIFDESKSNILNNLLTQINYDDFLNRTLLKKTSNYIEFENAEFQDYLAAKELVDLERAELIVSRRFYDEEIKEIIPHWLTVIGFLVQIDKTILNKILKREILSGKENISDIYTQLLKGVSDAQNLGESESSYVFDSIYDHYQIRENWIDYSIEQGLANYYTPKNKKTLEKYIAKKRLDSTKNDFVLKGNTASIIEHLFQRSLLSDDDKELWLKRLKRWSKTATNKTALPSKILSAVGALEDINELISFDHLYETGDNGLRRHFIRLLQQCNEESAYSIDKYVESMMCKRRFDSSLIDHEAWEGIFSLKKAESIKYFFRKLEDDDIWKAFVESSDKDFFMREIDNFIDRIKENWDEEVQKLVTSTFMKVFEKKYSYEIKDNAFLPALGTLTASNENIVDDLFKIINSKERAVNSWYYRKNIVSILDEKNVKEIFSRMEELDTGSALLLYREVVQANKTEIIKIIDKYFPQIKKENEEVLYKHKKHSCPLTQEEIIYRQFQKYLHPSPGQYKLKIFDFYKEKKEIIKQQWTSLEKEDFLRLIKNKISVDPLKGNITYTHRGESSSNYNISQFVGEMSGALGAYHDDAELKINLNSKLRQNIVNYIPFGYYQNFQVIKNLIGQPTENEFSKLAKVYTENRRDDDLKIHSPSCFIQFSKQYKLKSAIPALMTFVKNKKLSDHERISALEALGEYCDDVIYFKKLFARTPRLSQAKKVNELKEISNEILIKKIQNDEAIKWRISEIKKRQFKLIIPEGAHSVGNYEEEFHDKKFAKPLIELKDPNYFDEIINFLDLSVKAFEKGVEYDNYGFYLRKIVVEYTKNLRDFRDPRFINEIEKWISRNSKKKSVNWFRGSLTDIKNHYLDRVKSPIGIRDSIRDYNEIKSWQNNVYSSYDEFYHEVKKIIKHDVHHVWGKQQGGYSIFKGYNVYSAQSGKPSKKQNETMLQLLLKNNLESALFKRGLISGIEVIREPQLLDGTKVDFLISYSFYPPILIELKLCNNSEISNKTQAKRYYKKMQKYRGGFTAGKAILLYYQTEEAPTKDDIGKILLPIYDDPNIDLIGCDCFEDYLDV